MSLKTNLKIYGLIGYDIVKEYDLLFNYTHQKLTLIKPEHFIKFKASNYSSSKTETVPLELKKHIPVVQASIGNQEYSLGIDCGAETNLMKMESLIPVSKYLENRQTNNLSGAGKNTKQVITAEIKAVKIGNKLFKNMTTVFSDIAHLNTDYSLDIDGLLGYEMLSKQKTLLSYKRKTLTFID